MVSADDMLVLLSDLAYTLQLNEPAARLLYKEYRDRQGQLSRADVTTQLMQPWMAHLGMPTTSAVARAPASNTGLAQQLKLLINTDQVSEVLANCILPLLEALGTKAAQDFAGYILSEWGAELSSEHHVLLLRPPSSRLGPRPPL